MVTLLLMCMSLIIMIIYLLPIVLIVIVIYGLLMRRKNSNKNISTNTQQNDEKRIGELNRCIRRSSFGLRNKGETGEDIIELRLMSLNIPKKIIRNLYIPYNGSTTEVDIVLITEYGLYVFESKNYSGWIFGNENNKYWTQMFSKSEKYKFYNPIFQNRTHINALSEFLNMDRRYFHSCILFGSRAELKQIPPDTQEYHIMYYNKLYEYIVWEINTGAKVLQPWDIENIYNILLPMANVSDEIKAQHIEHIKRYRS